MVRVLPLPLEVNRDAITTLDNVGTATDNIECKVVGVKIALQAVERYSSSSDYKINDLDAFILTDCVYM